MLVNTYYAQAIAVKCYTRVIMGEISLILDRIIELIQTLKIEDDFKANIIHTFTNEITKNTVKYTAFKKQLATRIGKTIYLDDAKILYKNHVELVKNIVGFYNTLSNEIHGLDLNEKQLDFIKTEEETINESISNFNILNGILENYLLKENV